MSTVTVNTKELSLALKDIPFLIPKGANTVPLGLYLSSNKLSFIVNTTSALCSYVNTVSDVSLNITVLYSDITEYLDYSCDTVLDIFDTGVTVTNAGFTATFSIAYSFVENITTEEEFVDFKSESVLAGLNTLMSARLAQLYKKEPAISIYGEVAVLKYPHIWLQVRTIGCPFKCTLTEDAVKLLLHYKPDKVAKSDNNLIVFSKGNSKLYIWSSENTDDNNFSTLLQDMSEPLTLNIADYAEQLATASKIKCSNVNISIHSNSIRTTFKSGNTTISLACGEASQFQCSFTLPTQLWVHVMKTLKSSKVQILYGGGKICLRNQNCVMVLSAVV